MVVLERGRGGDEEGEGSQESQGVRGTGGRGEEGISREGGEGQGEWKTNRRERWRGGGSGWEAGGSGDGGGSAGE